MGKKSVQAPRDVPFAWRGLELQEAGCPRGGVCLATSSCSPTEQLQSCIFFLPGLVPMAQCSWGESVP